MRKIALDLGLVPYYWTFAGLKLLL